MNELSELDTAILRELQNSARTTNRAIAEAVHVAPSTSLERIRSLRERGVIRGYHAEADLAALGREVQALIAIRIRPPSRENIEAFRDWAHQLPETVGVFVVSGGDDFLLYVAVSDTDALYLAPERRGDPVRWCSRRAPGTRSSPSPPASPRGSSSTPPSSVLCSCRL